MKTIQFMGQTHAKLSFQVHIPTFALPFPLQMQSAIPMFCLCLEMLCRVLFLLIYPFIFAHISLFHLSLHHTHLWLPSLISTKFLLLFDPIARFVLIGACLLNNGDQYWIHHNGVQIQTGPFLLGLKPCTSYLTILSLCTLINKMRLMITTMS